MGYYTGVLISLVIAGCAEPTPARVPDAARPIAGPSSAPTTRPANTKAPTKVGPIGTAYFVHGHGVLNDEERQNTREGRTAGLARMLLQKQGFTVEAIGGPGTPFEDVPADARLVVVLGPTSQLEFNESQALRRYLARGGALFVALDPESPTKRGVSAAPQLNPELADMLGLRFDGALLASHVHLRFRGDDSDRTLLVVKGFASHPSVATLFHNASHAAIVVFGAGSLESTHDAHARVEFTVQTTQDAFRDLSGDYVRQSDTEPNGPFNLAAAVLYSGVNGAEARAFVLADADAVSDLVMTELVANQVLFVEATRWLVGKENPGTP